MSLQTKEVNLRITDIDYAWFVATHFEKITHFEKKISSAFLGPNQRTLKNKFSKCVNFGINITHFEKNFQSALECTSTFLLM